jgi:hypothetical protein
VAAEAGVGPNFCILILEGKDEPFSLRLCVFLSRAVAGFTAFLLLGNLGIDHALPVRSVLLKGIIDLRMAILAGLGSNISSSLLFWLVLAEGSKAEKEENDGRAD